MTLHILTLNTRQRQVSIRIYIMALAINSFIKNFFGGKLIAECPNTRNPLPTLLYMGFHVKLKKNPFESKTNLYN